MIILICIIAVIIIVLLCACLAIANFAGESFYEKFLELSKVKIESQVTVIDFFRYVNEKFFGNRLVLASAKDGGDAYAKGILFLSNSTIHSDNIASFAIIAHELGHAEQDISSKKLKKMSALRRFGTFVGLFMFPLLIAGLVLIILGGGYFYWGVGLAVGGLLIFILAIVIKALTINIEKEASQNAIEFLQEILTPQEINTCKQFLNDAKLTYWADMFRSLLGWTMLTRKGKLFR